MQTHQEWLQNRNYEHHLHSLTRIFKRNENNSPSKQKKKPNPKKEENQKARNSGEVKPQKINSSKYRNIVSANQTKRILWDNFLLGKRILEVSPVVSRKKTEWQFKQHKRLLYFRSLQNKSQSKTAEFRQAKFRQFNEHTQRSPNSSRLPTRKSRNILVLQINQIEFIRYSGVQDIIIKIEGKKGMQSSDIIDRENPSSKSLLFRYNVTPTQKAINLTAHVYQIKGLEERPLAQFYLPKSEITDTKKTFAQALLRAGNAIGSIEFSVHHTKRSSLLSIR